MECRDLLTPSDTELNLTWLNSILCPTLSNMQKRPVQRGRPVGTKTFEGAPARAFGAAVRAARMNQNLAQEALAHRAAIERSHIGKIERGEHMPNLALILKIAKALECSPVDLIAATMANLQNQ